MEIGHAKLLPGGLFLYKQTTELDRNSVFLSAILS
jgi:hypothetical protein